MKSFLVLSISLCTAGLLVVCSLTAALAGSLDRGTMQERYNGATKDMLRVPGVVGLSEQEALGLMQQSGLAVKIKRLTKELPKYADQEGQVVRQEPSSGGLAMIGSTVTLTIYKKTIGYGGGYSDSAPGAWGEEDPPSDTWGEGDPPSDTWGGSDSSGEGWRGPATPTESDGLGGSGPSYDGGWSSDSSGGGWNPPAAETEETPPAIPSTVAPDSSATFDVTSGPSAETKQPSGRKTATLEHTPKSSSETRRPSARKTSPPVQGAPTQEAPSMNPASERGGSASPAKSAAGRPALPGVSLAGKQARGHNAVSAPQLRKMNESSREFNNFKRQMAAAERRTQERMRALTKEAYLSGADCDDSDAEVSPGRVEICDHKDNDCDGVIDEGVGTYKFADVDGDSHGDPDTMMKVCPSDIEEALRGGDWLADVGNDCDDQDARHWNDCVPAASR